MGAGLERDFSRASRSSSIALNSTSISALLEMIQRDESDGKDQSAISAKRSKLDCGRETLKTVNVINFAKERIKKVLTKKS